MKILARLLLSVVAFTQGACGWIPENDTNLASYTVGGTVTGLAGGSSLTLLDNGGDTLVVTADGSFTFPTPIQVNGSYVVTVGTAPPGQQCSIANGSGAGVTANVSNVTVACSTGTRTQALGGTVSGLSSGAKVTLLNGSDLLTVSADGVFSFASPIPQGGSYSITVAEQPAGQVCTVSNGSGVIADVADVAVVCSAITYTIGGTVTGLPSSGQVTLLNNASDPLTVRADGSFVFSTPVAYQGSYSVTVGTQPVTLACLVSAGSGSNVAADVTGISIACSPGQASILSSFAGGGDGRQIVAPLVQGSDGDFYGTSYAGGSNDLGTIFKITAAGVRSILHSFGGAGDGANPRGGLLLGADGNFYGSTVVGGANGQGAVYRMTPAGAVTVLYSFAGGADGSAPYGELIQAPGGLLYGTTIGGGSGNYGTVFSITTAGVATVLHVFNGTDGAAPLGTVLRANDGNLYGTTTSGGVNNYGTVFRMTPAGVLTSLHSFASADGLSPTGGLAQGADGNLYGTTQAGGVNSLGTAFRITPSGVLTTLHMFGGSNDGSFAFAGLTPGNDGNFYGTTIQGGTYNQGTLYQMSPSGVVTVLHSFGNAGDPVFLYAGVIQARDGNLYGGSYGGGASNQGAVFRFGS